MRRFSVFFGVVVPVALLASGCSSGGDGAAVSPSSGPSGSGGVSRLVWTAPVDPVESPVAVAGGAAFHAFTARRFEVVSVAAADGRVRWRAPASPSRVDHGVGLSVTTLDAGRVVMWMEPGKVFGAGDVSVVAADAVTGARRWSYGAGRVRLPSAPAPCRQETAVCFLAYPGGSDSPRAVVLDGRTGRVLVDEPAPFQGAVRRLAEGLYGVGDELAAVDERGRLRWHRMAASAFGAPADPDFGWDIQLKDGRYVGTLGRTRDGAGTAGSAAAGGVRVPVQDIAASAAVDAATGKTLWVRPRSSTFCGQLEFDLDHPVLCRSTGQATLPPTGPPTVTGLDVTLEGLDPSTGRNRWEVHLGAVPGLWRPGPDVLRVDDTTYTIRGPQGLLRLDLDRGPQPGAASESGWCAAEDAAVTPAENVTGVNPAGVVAYSVDRWYPCRLGGAAQAEPARPAGFAGATVQGVFVYTDQDGHLRAVRTG